VPAECLDRWIDDLRDRLKRGDLVGLRPIELGYGTGHLPAETTVRIMLADLDGWQDLPRRYRERREHVLRRLTLLDEFRRLRELIG
jgi:hypothetical protein